MSGIINYNNEQYILKKIKLTELTKPIIAAVPLDFMNYIEEIGDSKDTKEYIKALILEPVGIKRKFGKLKITSLNDGVPLLRGSRLLTINSYNIIYIESLIGWENILCIPEILTDKEVETMLNSNDRIVFSTYYKTLGE